MTGRVPWRLEGFLAQLDLWVERERPEDDVVLLVTAWIMTRQDDPYRGVRRADGFENLWFGAVPDTEDGRGSVVTCSYWISETQHVVRCDSYATLSLPL